MPNARTLPYVIASFLSLCYFQAYFASPAAPGNGIVDWWGWWDQSNYLRSARALAHGMFDKSLHWYPLGYPLLGAPFVRMARGHPYVFLDLACLLLTYVAFLSFARAVSVGRTAAALIFSIATFGSASLRDVWIEPWNTTLSAALIWSMLALTPCLLVRAGRRWRALSVIALGWLAVSICFCRPTDALVVGIWAMGLGTYALHRRTVGRRDLVAMLAGVVVAAVPYAVLWWRIYGFHVSDYMIEAGSLGFSLRGLWWKTYLLLMTPRPWFPFGAGLLQRLPWIVPGLAGMLAMPWTTTSQARVMLCMLGASIAAYSTLFFSYVDLLPSGLWYYHNVHYFVWVFPGLLLMGFVWARAIVLGPRRPAAIAMAVVVVLSGLKLEPEVVGPGGPAWVVQLHGVTPSMADSYMARMALSDDLGVLSPTRDYRVLPDGQGWRLIALRRPFVGVLVGSDRDPWSGALQRPVVRWGMTLRYGWPCWLGLGDGRGPAT